MDDEVTSDFLIIEHFYFLLGYALFAVEPIFVIDRHKEKIYLASKNVYKCAIQF